MQIKIAKFMIPIEMHQAFNNPHQFYLARIKESSPSAMVIVNFQPTIKRNQAQESITPRFNQDKLHFTASFMLASQEKILRKNIDYQRKKFDLNVQDTNEKSITKNMLKYLPNSKYCQVCRITYNNYLEHISSLDHLENVRTSKGNFSIKEICQKFKGHNRNTRKESEAQNRVQPKKTKSLMFKKDKGVVSKGIKEKAKSTFSRATNPNTIVAEQTIKVASY